MSRRGLRAGMAFVLVTACGGQPTAADAPPVLHANTIVGRAGDAAVTPVDGGSTAPTYPDYNPISWKPLPATNAPTVFGASSGSPCAAYDPKSDTLYVVLADTLSNPTRSVWIRRNKNWSRAGGAFVKETGDMRCDMGVDGGGLVLSYVDGPPVAPPHPNYLYAYTLDQTDNLALLGRFQVDESFYNNAPPRYVASAGATFLLTESRMIRFTRPAGFDVLNVVPPGAPGSSGFPGYRGKTWDAWGRLGVVTDAEVATFDGSVWAPAELSVAIAKTASKSFFSNVLNAYVGPAVFSKAGSYLYPLGITSLASSVEAPLVFDDQQRNRLLSLTASPIDSSLVVFEGVIRASQGTRCTDATACLSGHCVDGVCCETACDGDCEACSVELKLSIKEPGKCGQAKPESDPKCPQIVPNTCSADNVQVVRGAEKVASCAPYLCATGRCRSECNSVSDCTKGYVCSSVNTCTLQPQVSSEPGAGGCCNSGPGTGRPPSGCLLAAVGLGALAWRRGRRRLPPSDLANLN